MNKELIKTYFKEFEHWLNGGKVLSKYTLLPEWSDNQTEDIWRIPSKDISKVLIVINDEYVEFRKAMAEGKTVQYQDYFSKEWLDMKTDHFHGSSDKFYEGVYRIKLDEPKFQIGDWITDGIEVWQHKENCKVKDQSSWRLWRPKPNEWCWVYDIKTNIPVIRKFICIDNESNVYQEDDLNTSLKYTVEKHDGSGTILYRYIEPFIGVLPSSIEKYSANE